MSNKVQKIREEVEKLHGNPYYMMAVKDVLEILDMQEEPVSVRHNMDEEKPPHGSDVCLLWPRDGIITIGEWNENGLENNPYVSKWAYKDDLLNLSNVKRTVKDWKEEPVSEDLGDYINELSKQFPEVSFAKLSRIAVRVAKWQKAKEYTCYEEAFEDGAKWKYERMMEKAIDAHVNYAWSGLSFGGFDWSKTGLDIGDKCKLIIIKED